MPKRKPLPTAAQRFKQMTDRRKGLVSLVGVISLLAVVASAVTVYMVMNLLEANSPSFDVLLWMPILFAGVSAILLWVAVILLSRFAADRSRTITVAKSKMIQ